MKNSKILNKAEIQRTIDETLKKSLNLVRVNHRLNSIGPKVHTLGSTQGHTTIFELVLLIGM